MPVNSALKRKNRVRFGLRKRNKTNKPRLNVFISNSHIYAQIIDDLKSETICSASSLKLKKKGANIELASKIGEAIAAEAKTKKVVEVVFDRGSHLYHGKVKALADAARDKGLKF